MRTTGIALIIASCLGLLTNCIIRAVSTYKYSKDFQSYWELSVKASSIEKKIEGVDKFVSALEKSNFAGKHNALFFKTPNNSFDENLAALKSLQTRLHEISKMDVKSFGYQTALQQITGQEQNKAESMLNEFRGVWYLNNFVMLWDWIAYVQICLLIVTGLVGMALIPEEL